MIRPLKFIVILESSSIEGRPLPKSLTKLIHSYRNNKRVSVDFFVPEVVFLEKKRHFINEVLKMEKDYTVASKLLSRLWSIKTAPIKHTKTQISQLLTQLFSTNLISIIKTPYKTINWKGLVQRAADKLPPFSPGESEKGFRDAVIAQTVLKSLSKYSKSNIAFICADGLLKQHIESKTRRRKTFEIYPSLVDFESALKLNLEKLDKKYISEITTAAELAFYNPAQPKKSLYITANVQQRIQDKYLDLFTKPKIPTGFGEILITDLYRVGSINWTPMETPRYEISKPIFKEKNRNIFTWSSTVVYRRKFEKQEAIASSLITQEKDYVDYILEFNVQWTASINKTGIVLNPKIIDITHVSTRRQDYQRTSRLSEYLSNSPLASGATLAGQGTVPVTNINITEPITTTDVVDINKIGTS